MFILIPSPIPPSPWPEPKLVSSRCKKKKIISRRLSQRECSPVEFTPKQQDYSTLVQPSISISPPPRGHVYFGNLPSICRHRYGRIVSLFVYQVGRKTYARIVIECPQGRVPVNVRTKKKQFMAAADFFSSPRFDALPG